MAQAMTTMTLTASVISLLVGASPMLWGQVRVKWLVTSLVSCVMFGVMGLMIRAFAEPLPETRAAPAAPPREIDWTATGLLLLVLLGLVGAVVGGRKAVAAAGRRRAKAAQRAKERLLAGDPAQVALTMAPDMADDVSRALDRIALLKSIGDRASRPEDADALVMIDRRVPSVMELYLRASEVCTPEERSAAARMALGSIIDIGRMAEDARQRIALDLRGDLDTESRYISSRTGRADGLGLD